MSKPKVHAELTDGDGGIFSGHCPDVTQHLWSQLGGSPNGFDRREVPSTSEGRTHPPVHHHGAEGVDPMKPAEFMHNVAMSLTLSG